MYFKDITIIDDKINGNKLETNKDINIPIDLILQIKIKIFE